MQKIISPPEYFKRADLFLAYWVSLFDHHLLHFMAIGIANADEINARGFQMQVLQTVRLIEVEDLLPHGIVHADLRGLAQRNGEVAICGVGVDADGS